MVALLSLAPLVDDSLLEEGEVIDADEHNRHRKNQRVRVNLLLDAARELQSHYASGTEPGEKRDGTLWYDNTNDILKAREGQEWWAVPGVDSLYSTALETAGTETFKVGGVLAVNTTQDSSSPWISYTLPADTLSANGQFVQVATFFSNEAGNSFSFGGSSIDIFASIANEVAQDFFIVRTAAGGQKIFGAAFHDTDGLGMTNKTAFALGTESLASNNSITISGPNTGAQEIALVSLRH